jgi:hypothetical protein
MSGIGNRMKCERYLIGGKIGVASEKRTEAREQLSMGWLVQERDMYAAQGQKLMGFNSEDSELLAAKIYVFGL